MQKIFFFLLVCITTSSSGQITWEKRYYDDENDSPDLYSCDVGLIFDTPNQSYLFAATTHGGIFSLHKLDLDGVLFYRNYLTSAGGSLKAAIFCNLGGILISDNEPHSTYTVKTLIKLDTANIVQWKYQYDIPLSTMRCGLVETGDNKFLLTGTAHFNPFVRPFIIKADSMGSPITVKYYTDLFAYPRKVIQTRDGNYIVAANAYLGDGAVLFKTDTSGVVLWAKSYLRPNGFIHDMIEKENGNIILIGNTDITSQTPVARMFIMETDPQGNSLWIKAYGDSINRLIFRPVTPSYFLPIQIKPTLDNGFIVVGSIKVAPNQTFEDLVLLKIDSTGNVQWERRHGFGLQYENGLQVIQTPDTGYFVAGVFNDHDPWIPKSGYYFLKTDSLGSIGCGDYSDSIAVINLLPTDSSFSVTDSTLTINIFTALVHDTTYAMADSLPNCFEVNVAEYNSDDIFSFITFPNPTTGIFHLSLPPDAIEAKDIFIYDLMGREVSATFGTRQTDFDFTLSGKGIYLVKIFSEGKTVVKKVVVL